jgi:UDP-N-acetylmuramate dehydrogenase
VCIQIGENFADMTISGTDVLAGPGVWIPGLARKALNAGLTGAEHICGVPSTLGGLVCMNGGTQRKGIGDAVVTVESVDREGHLTTRTADQCGFAYRTSAFQSNDEVIGQVRLRFRPALDVRAVRQEMLSILRSRKARFPKRLPNCGSVFVSNPAMYEAFGPPGALIEALGFKGIVEGGAQVSNQHANFINNLGGATAKDVLTLIHRIKQAVLDHTGYEMRAEARFVAPDGRMMPADAKEVWLG